YATSLVYALSLHDALPILPFYLASGVYTMPEFLERRYSAGARWYLAVISIIGYVLTKISVTIAAGGIVFEALMGMDFWTGALIRSEEHTSELQSRENLVCR